MARHTFGFAFVFRHHTPLAAVVLLSQHKLLIDYPVLLTVFSLLLVSGSGPSYSVRSGEIIGYVEKEAMPSFLAEDISSWCGQGMRSLMI